MDTRASLPLVPLHLTSLAILTPTNAPLYVHSFTGREDELRHYHLAHAAIDVMEERIVMTSTPTKPADSYLGLLFCMEDMAFYGFQTTTKLRMILSVALVDAMIKDGDIISIFRAVHHLIMTAVNNPFLSLPSSFKARPASRTESVHGQLLGSAAATQQASTDELPPRNEKIINAPFTSEKIFAAGPEDIQEDWLRNSRRFQLGIRRLGDLLSGGRN
ncbi:Sedlin, N-terminal conserved region-domain-containing protein [Kockovaella imperatae]|uniref:Sedlin, N-terminal conserved region-domain-containing protein n=1 Tax=Kockovaella imperatae TaxID=4999 RepID=A0A1Y1UQC8_9TREE|nr:Sedlin, N-terminal conserved region-domain-containing protein [Kockovaella imperatae]ORX39767.1 Sedlin, N-terminal conserved region-domain-containing protein [Kockovaella imperatae]